MPVASVLGDTVNETAPSPSGETVSGGRNPAVGSSVGSPVSGSIDEKCQVTRPVAGFRCAAMRAIRFVSGRRSTSRLKSPVGDDGNTVVAPKETGPNAKVERSTLAGSSWSVTTTSCAGAVAVSSLVNCTR